MSDMTVSVVIPCYNAEPFLAEAIESALTQSTIPDQVIVVDDGSTDGSSRVAETFGKRVVVIRRAHGGIGAVRNAGVAAASGDLIAWLDADDVWEPHKLELQLPHFADPSVGLVYCQARKFGVPGVSPSPHPAETPEGDVFERLYFRNFIPCSTAAIVRREAIVGIGGFDESLPPAEDFDAWLRMALAWRFAAVPRVLCHYRQHHSQASGLRARAVRCGLRARDKLAPELERRTGMSSRERRQRLASIYLDELSRMIRRRDLRQARALAAVLEEAFASDSAEIREAIAYNRRMASLPRPALWLLARLGRRPMQSTSSSIR